jgi:hypothetical protein
MSRGGVQTRVATYGKGSSMVEKSEVTKTLARKHFEIEPGITRIFEIVDQTKDESSAETPIKLLEVNDATIPSGILPLYFAPVPARGVPFPTVIIEVTPEEFEQIEANSLPLPSGWILGPEIPRGAA